MATIIIQSPTRRRANQSASDVCRIRATDRGGRQHVVKIRHVNGKAALIDCLFSPVCLCLFKRGDHLPCPLVIAWLVLELVASTQGTIESRKPINLAGGIV